MENQIFRYKYFDRAIIRTPMFPWEALRHHEVFWASKDFEEAIKIASPELYRAKRETPKDGSNAKDRDKVEKIEISLHKYFSRASTRSTPFGLFAGCSVVSVGEVEDKTQITLPSIDKYRRCTRLDMQYLCALIQSLEADPEIRPKLRFYPNDSLYPIAGQLRYVEYLYKGTHRSHQIVSIEQNEFVEAILNAAKEGLMPHDLAAILVDEEIGLDDALQFVNEMIDSQVLKSELEPAVVGEDAMLVLIAKLHRIGENEVTNKLVEIGNILTDIDNTPVGGSIDMYDRIIEIIKSIGVGHEEKFLFQTDMFKLVESGGISKDVIEDVNDCLVFLSKINHPYQNENLQKFKRDFIERYETEEIPLAIALDNELGIGYPNKNNNDVNPLVDDLVLPFLPSEENRISISATDLVLLKKYVEAIRQGDKIIRIEEKDFQSVYRASEDVYPDTCAAMCSVINDKDGGNTIYLKSAGSGAANLLGRFCHIDTGVNELVKTIADFESNRKPDAMMAEISHLPESRIGNISSRPVFRDVIIHYLSNTDETTKQNLDISDLVLSVKNDRLHLRSKQFDKEIIPRLTCAHNYSITPIPMYRFLCDLQFQDPSVRFSLQWGELFNEFDYLPRIQYKNIIFSRQRWSIKKEELKDCHKMSDSELLYFFETFVGKRELAVHVVLLEGDNEMYMDLTDIKGIKLLLSIVGNRASFVLCEFLFPEYDSVVVSEAGSYANEVLFAFHK